ncbi:outer membrane beta-barrel protein [Pelomonas sp. KK5]|uniref:outer membrane beta-barrel protein n=1 Tax=Pelomonas sp. KK5 TaxID=1855730 RepID=UPI00097BCE39|nr:outer membrane beta-barrel protein [Pelomonas sp. KK5]
MNQAPRLTSARWRPCLAFIALGAAALAAQAEPFTAGSGYMGLNVGKPSFKTDCGNAGFNCDNPNASFKLYGGAMFNQHFGAELGYLNMGKAERGGGHSKAEGINMSLVGHVPLGESRFGAFAKGGATYGRTRVDAQSASGIATGRESGWGGAYGAGVDYALSPTSAVVLEWEHHDFRFPGTGREGVAATSLGFVKRF